MKNFLYVSVLAATISLILVSCNKNTPEAVVEKYCTCYYQNNFTDIQNYVTESNKEFYRKMAQALENSQQEVVPNVAVKNIECEVESDTNATCSCLIQITDPETSEQEEIKKVIPLKMENKTWLVDLGKEDMLMPEDKDANTSSKASKSDAGETVKEFADDIIDGIFSDEEPAEN